MDSFYLTCGYVNARRLLGQCDLSKPRFRNLASMPSSGLKCRYLVTALLLDGGRLVAMIFAPRVSRMLILQLPITPSTSLVVSTPREESLYRIYGDSTLPERSLPIYRIAYKVVGRSLRSRTPRYLALDALLLQPSINPPTSLSLLLADVAQPPGPIQLVRRTHLSF